MYDFLKVLVANLFMPLPFFLILMVLGILLMTFNWKKLGGFLTGFAVLTLTLLSLPPVSDALIGSYENQYAPHTKTTKQDFKAIVVLGAGWSYNRDHPASVRLKENSAMRLMEGIRLAKLYPNAKLVVSGASRVKGIQPVALGYKQTAIALGLAPERIVTLTTPVDTGKEAKAFKKWMSSGKLAGTGFSSFESNEVNQTDFLLVTSASHMPRAMRHFQNTGLNPTAAPTTFKSGEACTDHWVYWLPSTDSLEKSKQAWYEFLANQATRFEH